MNVYPETQAVSKSPQSPLIPPRTLMSVGSYGSNACTSRGEEKLAPQSAEALYAIASTLVWLRTSANWRYVT